MPAPDARRNHEPEPTLTERLQEFHQFGPFRALRTNNRHQGTTDYISSARFDCEIDHLRQPVYVIVYGSSPINKNFIVVSDFGWVRGGSFTSYEVGSVRVPNRISPATTDLEPVLLGLLGRMGHMPPLFDNGTAYGDFARAKEDIALALGWAGVRPTQIFSGPDRTESEKSLKSITDPLQFNGDPHIPRWYGFGLASGILARGTTSDVHAWWARCVLDVCGEHPEIETKHGKVPKYPPDAFDRVHEIVGATDASFGSVAMRRKILRRVDSAMPSLTYATVRTACSEVESFGWRGGPVALEKMLRPDVPDNLWTDLVEGLARDFAGRFGPELADRLVNMRHDLSPSYSRNRAINANFARLRVEVGERYDLTWSKRTAVRLLRSPTDVDVGVEGRRVTALLEILAWGLDRPGSDPSGSIAQEHANEIAKIFREQLESICRATSNVERRVIAACWLKFGQSLEVLEALTQSEFTYESAGPYPDAVFDAEVARISSGVGEAIKVLESAADQIVKNPPLNPTLSATRVIRNLLHYYMHERRYDDAEKLIQRLFSEQTNNFARGENGFDLAARCAGFYLPPHESDPW